MAPWQGLPKGHVARVGAIGTGLGHGTSSLPLSELTGRLGYIRVYIIYDVYINIICNIYILYNIKCILHIIRYINEYIYIYIKCNIYIYIILHHNIWLNSNTIH